MIDKIFNTFFGNRHRFRHMTFDELSELYTSMMFRTLAISMAGIFVPIYLLELGYDIWEILLFFAVMFGFQSLVVRSVAHLLAFIGPKHSIAISFILQSAVLIGIAYLPYLPSQSVWILSVAYGVANLLFFLAFNVDFSRFKHTKKEGKEVGLVYVMERLGAVSGPLVGGLVAFFFSAQYIFLVAVILLFSAAIPLLFSMEHLKVKQKLHFDKLSLKNMKRDTAAYTGMVTDTSMTMIMWPLFLGVVVFQGNPYIQLGFITSLSILISVFAARAMGKMIDNRQGRRLLHFGVFANLGVYLLRPFTSGFAMALGLNMARECVTPAIRMPQLKGIYDSADSHPGQRIVYMANLELASTTFRGLLFGATAVAAYFMTVDRLFFAGVFLVGGLISLMILLERYPALNPGRRRS